MKLWAAVCAVPLAVCACAAKQPRKEPPIAAVRITFRSHLSAVRSCEDRGLVPSPEAAKASGANLALVFAPPAPAVPGKNPPDAGDEPAWLPFEGETDGVAGVRAFRCPDVFVEGVVAGMKRAREGGK